MKFTTRINDREINVDVQRDNGNFLLKFPDSECKVEYRKIDNNSLSLLIDGKYFRVNLEGLNGNYNANLKGQNYKIQIEEEWKTRFSRSTGTENNNTSVEVRSPMPGKVVRIHVKVGDKVIKDQGIIVVEAMKMENELCSPVSGVINKIKVDEGHVAGGKEVLLVITPD